MNLKIIVAGKVAIFAAAHIAGLAGFILCWLWLVGYMVPVTGEMIAWCVTLYFVRMFGITGVYHRYFAHRTFRTSRIFQFCLAFLGATASQKGPLWWAAHHRHHHRFSDTEDDVHSPIVRGFIYSHIGWLLFPASYATRYEDIKDFAKYWELRLLDTWWVLPPVLLATACWWLGGWGGLIVSFFLSTVLLWHGTFCINSLTHLYGSKSYKTGDESRNSFVMALITMGEGWHNNHHRFPASERQGIWQWQLDITHYIIVVMSWAGLVWAIQTHTNLSGYSQKIYTERME